MSHASETSPPRMAAPTSDMTFVRVDAARWRKQGVWDFKGWQNWSPILSMLVVAGVALFMGNVYVILGVLAFALWGRQMLLDTKGLLRVNEAGMALEFNGPWLQKHVGWQLSWDEVRQHGEIFVIQQPVWSDPLLGVCLRIRKPGRAQPMMLGFSEWGPQNGQVAQWPWPEQREAAPSLWVRRPSWLNEPRHRDELARCLKQFPLTQAMQAHLGEWGALDHIQVHRDFQGNSGYDHRRIKALLFWLLAALALIALSIALGGSDWSLVDARHAGWLPALLGVGTLCVLAKWPKRAVFRTEPMQSEFSGVAELLLMVLASFFTGLASFGLWLGLSAALFTPVTTLWRLEASPAGGTPSHWVMRAVDQPDLPTMSWRAQQVASSGWRDGQVFSIPIIQTGPWWLYDTRALHAARQSSKP